MSHLKTTRRLEYLRGELRAERISQGELMELSALADYIDPGDVELLEAAGVPEFPESDDMVDCVEDIVIDGEGDDGTMVGDGEKPPFALFSPHRQENVGGPYAERGHAEAALEAINRGVMIPYTSGPCIWTLNGKVHPAQRDK